MNNGSYAFNGEEIQVILSNINVAYNSLMRAIGDDSQAFVNDMRTVWASKEAVSFFTNEFKPKIDSIITSVTESCQSTFNAIKSAAESWAAQTQNSFVASTSFSPYTKTMNVDGYPDNIGGDVGWDFTNGPTVIQKLTQIKTDVADATQKFKEAAANGGFLGESQLENLVSSLSSISIEINNALLGFIGSLEQSLKTAEANHMSLASQVAKSFTIGD